MELSVSISGLENIEGDFKTFQSGVSTAARSAIDSVGSA